MIHGPDISEVRERAKTQVMWHFVARAELDGTPPTLRALYVLKAQQAELVLAHGSSTMIEREAELRGVTALELAQTISDMARQSEALEIARMEVNIAVDAASDEDEIVKILAGVGVDLKM